MANIITPLFGIFKIENKAKAIHTYTLINSISDNKLDFEMAHTTAFKTHEEAVNHLETLPNIGLYTIMPVYFSLPNRPDTD